MSEEAFANALGAGIRYDHWVFAPAGHITEGNNDEYGPAARFLGTHTVDRNPAHVTYVRDPANDFKEDGHADHAYWISRLKLRDTGATGSIDAVSHAFGTGDPAVLPVQLSAGTLNGGSHGPLPYTRRTLAWGPTPKTARADRLDVTVRNLAAATIAVRRAHLDCRAQVHVDTDGPIRLTLLGCHRTVRAG
jgi:hypothetical protein